MEIYVSALFAFLAFSFRELLKHRSLAQSVSAEAIVSKKLNNETIGEISDQALATLILESDEYRPYFIIQNPPHDLYRTAMDDCYLFNKSTLQNLTKTYKLEQTIELLIHDIHTQKYGGMNKERRLGYCRRILEDLGKINAAHDQTISSLQYWTGRGVVVSAAILCILIVGFVITLLTV